MIKETTMKKGLPKKTISLCPDCGKKIPATIIAEDGKAVMVKTCPEHGEIKEVIWSDVDLYLWAERYSFDGIGVENPFITKKKPSCPEDCGLCNLHKSHTVLANLDLTNRCNLTCPVCFANANTSGVVFEPTYEEVVKMLKVLRAEKPVPCHAVQFAGGEPTIHPDFFKILKAAKELGISQVQIATNGIKFAESQEFVQNSQDAGLNTIYLQFDGLDDNMYKKVRGMPMTEIKKKAIHHIRKTKQKHKMSVCLTPTIVKTVNDHMMGDIVNFAIDNIDIVHAVNFQPVSFAGRINQKEREAQRFTISDMMHGLEDQLDFLTAKDFYPVPAMTILSDLISVLHEEPKVTFSAHPHCGVGTFVFITKDKEAIPVTRFVRVTEMLDDLHRMAVKRTQGMKDQTLSYKIMKGIGSTGVAKRIAVGQFIKRYIIKNKVPDGLDVQGILQPLFVDGDKSALSKFTWNALMIGGMHFQDHYNWDIERVQRCVIHYVTPDGRIIPFCNYNTGATFRTEVEKKFSIPVDEWKKMHPGSKVVEPSPLVDDYRAKMKG